MFTHPILIICFKYKCMHWQRASRKPLPRSQEQCLAPRNLYAAAQYARNRYDSPGWLSHRYLFISYTLWSNLTTNTIKTPKRPPASPESFGIYQSTGVTQVFIMTSSQSFVLRMFLELVNWSLSLSWCRQVHYHSLIFTSGSHRYLSASAYKCKLPLKHISYISFSFLWPCLWNLVTFATANPPLDYNTIFLSAFRSCTLAVGCN